MGKNLPTPHGLHCRSHKSLYDGDGSPAQGEGYSKMLGRASRFMPHPAPGTRVQLDSMAVWVPSQQAFDELIYPPYEPCNCHSCHYVVRGVMDLEESMPQTKVAVYDNDHLLS